MDSNVAENINILAKFLGTRDIDVLNQEELFERYGIHQADVMVLFGGSIVEGAGVAGGLAIGQLEAVVRAALDRGAVL